MRRRMRRREILSLRAQARAAFAEAVRGRSVALIGGAHSLLEHGDGAAIDACDVVVRVNWPRDAELVPPRTGSRTDFHYRASGMAEEGPDVLRKPGELVSALLRDYGGAAMPRTGVVALEDILRYEPARVYVAGFDLYRSGHSVNPSTSGRRAKGHDNELDFRILRDLCADSRVESDAILKAALADAPLTEDEAQDVHVEEASGMIIRYRKKKATPAKEPSGWESMTVAELREELRALDLPTSGTKAELVARIEEALA